jgi:branched-chain amino acid transport system ATP-binding protein
VGKSEPAGEPVGTSGSLLAVRDLSAFYGRVQVLRRVSLHVERRECVAVLGPNGAGKTSLLRSITGAIKTEGEMTFDGRSISRAPTHRIARLGIGHVPEGRGTFVDLTVEENLRLGLMGRSRAKDARAEDLERVYQTFPILQQFRTRPAGALSGGQQQILALMRSLLARPTLLLIDEPSLGLAPLVTAELFDLLAVVRETWDLAVLLAEQNVRRALGVADRAYVLSSGSITSEGTVDELTAGQDLMAAYLGETEELATTTTGDEA